MVIGAFPVFKLGVLAANQISKPIAQKITTKAKNSPVFRNYICIPPAQFYNWLEVKTKMWTLNLGKPVSVPPLSENMAIELGANLLGEFIVFAIGSGILIFEFSRQMRKEKKQKRELNRHSDNLKQKLEEMSYQIQRQEEQIKELTQKLAGLGVI